MSSDNSSVQSFERGMKILELLSKNEDISTSEIGKTLGIHQSSVSRFLNAMLKSGIVKKPDFHSFTLDYGILLFAGRMLQKFPLVPVATEFCNEIFSEYGFCATAAVLFNEELIYLATASDKHNIRLIDAPGFPLYRSSLGRALLYEEDPRKAIAILEKSIKITGSNESASEIYEKTAHSISQYGFLFMKNEYANLVNAAKVFEYAKEKVCLAVYSEKKDANPAFIGKILDDTIDKIQKKVSEK